MHDGPPQPRERPPWWPPDQPWPPPESVRRHMLRRWPWRGAAVLGVLLFMGMLACVLLTALVLVLFLVAPVHINLPELPTPPGPPTGPGSWRTGLIIAAAFALGILLIGARIVRRVSVPFGELLDASGRIAEGDYRARISEHGPREMRSVARAFNGMAARLEEHDEQRRLLLADVTHELRTPLTVIQGNLEGLIDGIYPRDDEHLAPILEETHVLSRLIDDLRTLSLVETGALQLKKEPVDLAALAGETVASFRAQADATGVVLAVEAAGTPAPLDVDPARIREVLTNLLVNALRYTPSGGCIRVQVRAEPGLPAAIAVADTGRGIPPDELPHIFDRFYKSSDSRGTGLGLTIAKNLIVAHGGEIVAESPPGQGTTIRFTLPRNM
jgi:signal transduction histidine kinase